ncbi:MAG: porin family protein [Cytophagales bacterium]|nr:porin family protein [Cytophagales bacterium]
MFTKRKTVRVIAFFLLINFVFDLALPGISYALTSGPTAPEYTSFEPVDTTDMVNLATGDFTYNIPLLEVPGPSGGYPLSLSYHAGIQPGEEASWVGLGWTLNPGAITRIVNGYPDDHNGARRVVTDTWAGGERSGFSVGAGLAGANVNLAFSQDTYHGFGVGANIGFGYRFGSIGIGVSHTIGTHGGSRSEFGLSGFNGMISTDLKSISLSAFGGELSSDFNSVSWKASMLGISITSNSLKPSLSIAGLSMSQVNSNVGNITSEDNNFGLTVPLGVANVYLGYNYQRYYSNETSDVLTFGALHPGWNHPDTNSFDSYALLDPDEEGGIVDNPEVEKVLGGSMISFDSYNVTGQGINGNMRPYSFFNGSLFRQNLKKQGSEDYLIQYGLKNQPHGKANFRFINDFSNAAYYSSNYDPVEHLETGNLPRINSNNASGVEFSKSQANFKTEGWNYDEQNLAGSKQVKWFTNQDIKSGAAYSNHGFISLNDYSEHKTDVYEYDVSNQAGGFMITNESGVTYHYSIPVYAYDEYIQSKTIDNSQGEVTNTRAHPQPYAYTWLLTAITGPDYVNRNPDSDGTIGDDDWGYWVELDYGMWASNYRWRNPESGWHRDLDENIRTYSRGRKELYYLDAVKTRSHTALFVKDIREDAKGVSTFVDVDDTFTPKEYTNTCSYSCSGNVDRDDGTITYYRYPVSTMRLSEIVLMKNEDVAALSINKASGSEFDHQFTFDYEIANNECGHCNFTSKTASVHSGTNVLDKYDLEAIKNNGTLYGKVLRAVEFDNDQYDLCPGTSNSFSNDNLYTATPNVGVREKSGKLTLNSIRFLGKGAESVIPPMNFSYDEETPKHGSVTLTDMMTEENGTVKLKAAVSEHTPFEEGDIIEFQIGQTPYCGVIISMVLDGSDYEATINILGENIPEIAAGNIVCQTTKNPPYNRNHRDAWGFYKSDFEELGNKSVNEYVSKVSQKSVDSWSLRNVETSVGATIKIGFESDEYIKPVLAKKHILKIKTFDPLQNDEFKLTFVENNIDLKREFEENTFIDCDVWGFYNYVNGILNCSGLTDCELSTADQLYGSYFCRSSGKECLITEVGDNYIKISSPELKNEINADKTIERTLYTQCGGGFSWYARDCQITFSGDYDFFLGGFISSGYNQHGIFGGGVRTKFVELENETYSKKTLYTYSDNEASTGYTSYEPFDFLSPYIIVPEGNQPSDGLIKNFKNAILQNYSKVITNSRELPPPGVIYAQVKVEEEVQRLGRELVKAPVSRVYEFQTYDENMNERIVDDCETCAELYPGRTVTMRDYSSRLGSLKSVSTYDAQGNIVTRQETNYLHQGVDNDTYRQELASRYGNQGFTSELFNEFRIVEKEDEAGNLQNYNMAVMAVKEVYPSVITGTTTTNYKTGVTTETKNLAFDFYSGAVTQSLTTDSYGNCYLIESAPAYKQYNGMGLAMNGGKNMLTQEGATYIYKVAPDYATSGTKEGLVSASAQTWSDQMDFVVLPGDQADLGLQSGIWRKKSSYTWKGDDRPLENGLYPMDNFAGFDAWQNGQTPYAQWQKNSEVTRIDVHSHALEAMGIDSSYAATKMDSRQEQVLSTVVHARYDEFAYAGAEDELINDGANLFWGGVYIDQGQIDGNVSHTGDRSVSVNSGGNRTLRFDVADAGASHNHYRASVWTNNVNGRLVYRIDGGTEISTGVDAAYKSGDWYLINVDIPVSENSALTVYCTSASGTSNFDDFRLHPLDAAMASYVYNEWGELSHVLDAGNFYTEYVYNAMGQLTEVWTEILDSEYGGATFPEGYKGKIRSSKNIIHYARTNN